MTTNIKDMSFSELNSMIADFNKQMEDIRIRIEEAVSERQNRKDEAIKNWKLHTAQVLEDTKILLEMGIDMTTLTPDTFETDKEKLEEREFEVSEITDVVSENEGVVDDITVPTKNETFVENDRELVDEIKVDNGEVGNEISSKPLCEEERENPLLTPFYEIWELPIIKREKPIKEKTIDTTINPFTGKRMVTRTLIPFYKLFSDKPIRAGLKMGNLKYKKSFPDPEETRVFSVNGYSPTLTYTHSDFWMWIVPEYDENGEMISETPIDDELKMAA